MATTKAKTSRTKSVTKPRAKSKAPLEENATAKPGTAKSARAKARTVADKKPVKARAAKPKPKAETKSKPKSKPKTKPAGDRQAPALPAAFADAFPRAVAVNSKLVDIAHDNVNASLELARDLVGVRTPMEAMRLGIAYWYNNMHAAQAQAQELRELSAAFVASASEPIRKQIGRI